MQPPGSRSRTLVPTPGFRLVREGSPSPGPLRAHGSPPRGGGSPAAPGGSPRGFFTPAAHGESPGSPHGYTSPGTGPPSGRASETWGPRTDGAPDFERRGDAGARSPRLSTEATAFETPVAHGRYGRAAATEERDPDGGVARAATGPVRELLDWADALTAPAPARAGGAGGSATTNSRTNTDA